MMGTVHRRMIVALMLIVALGSSCPPAAAGETVDIHEWGTFTTLQDESGFQIGGIHNDDEPVPPFVHELAKNLLLSTSGLPPIAQSQGAPHGHGEVTMRLETPVLYFHPSSAAPVTADVSVTFKGGWFTQFYPDAH
jgi:hypothetical protein